MDLDRLDTLELVIDGAKGEIVEMAKGEVKKRGGRFKFKEFGPTVLIEVASNDVRAYWITEMFVDDSGELMVKTKGGRRFHAVQIIAESAFNLCCYFD